MKSDTFSAMMLTLLATPFATQSVFALDIWQNSQPIDKSARLTMGANASFNKDAYAQDDGVVVMPQAFYDNNRVYIEGAEAGIYGFKNAQNQWRITLSYDSRTFDASEANTTALQQLDDREWSGMLGTSYMRVTPYGGFKGQLETDITGNSDGTVAKLSHLSVFKLHDDKVKIYPEFGMQWHNDTYNQYYYGVSQEESARSGIAQYRPDSSLSPFVNVSASYAIHPRLSVFASQYLEFLSDEQKNSPMVDDDSISKTKIGFNYTF